MATRSNFRPVDAVADFFLLKILPDAGDSITNLKLQKLCYYAQAWSLVLRDEPCFDEDIQAWAHGPVVPELYQRFREYGWRGVDPCDLLTDPEKDLSQDDREFFEQIWGRYGHFSGRQLEALTHEEAPWKDAYGDTRPGGRCTKVISHEAMKKFYQEQLDSIAS